ncbi:MAG: hydrogenase nickel incorporation protein HypB [Bacteroidales bacterium]|nr:hydrogenase nickel incorporation protein HypB [Bacteroidales bacterium]
MEIKVMKRVLDKNQDKAEQVRSLLREKSIKMYNFISSPGAGKTALLERTLAHMNGGIRIAIIEGDVSTDRDAQRLKQYNNPIVLINTEGGCHLDSNSIEQALAEFNLDELDAVFVENVGNLVCPTHFDLGETAKIALVSTSEGDDKPIKYPMLFRDAEAVILNKMDLLDYTNFNYQNFVKDLREVNPNVPLIETSCTRNTGLEEWYEWLRKKIGEK